MLSEQHESHRGSGSGLHVSPLRGSALVVHLSGNGGGPSLSAPRAQAVSAAWGPILRLPAVVFRAGAGGGPPLSAPRAQAVSAAWGQILLLPAVLPAQLYQPAPG